MKPTIGRNRKYRQGRFMPNNLEKYIGNPMNIVYRSSWEKSFLQWCDTNPNIVKYNSEEVVIPYISPVDNRQHRYFIDFLIIVKQPDQTLKKFLVEVKPYAQTQPPRKTSAKTLQGQQRYADKVKTYEINIAKWKAAKHYAEITGSTFCIITEKELFKQKKKRR